jgi:hypothetical protein
MRMKTLALLGALAFSAAPFAAQADITIHNNTNAPATASVSISPCSNAAGDRGVIKPHSSITIPDFLVGLYCTSDCKAQVFMSRNCSGKSIATVTGNVRQGVKNIDNHSVKGFRLAGSGKDITIEGGPAKKWYNFLF